MPDYINQGYVFLFADDTTFYYVGHDIEEVIDMLNNIGGQVSEWCKRKQLTIHTGKSKAMIITRQDFIGPLRPVMTGNEIIKYVRKATSLGIEIDKHLRWETQVKKVTKSFSAKVGQLNVLLANQSKGRNLLQNHNIDRDLWYNSLGYMLTIFNEGY